MGEPEQIMHACEACVIRMLALLYTYYCTCTTYMDSDHGQLTWVKDHCYGGWIKPAAECARQYNKHWPMKQGLQLMRKASATVGVII